MLYFIRFEIYNVADFIIDISDIALLATKYNLISTSSSWNKAYDLNNDNIMNIFDLVICSKRIK
ncbi:MULTISPECIES: hypothetical protein [Clostridium]|uniref:hypothetical protein n=1 Tax=Clostridium TaxID=1485 RepID=UPI0011576532|nr:MULTISPECIES: hypothetical protein [Clostridium]MDU1280173.1 hypothetical protein [Clostridium sp.]MDU2156446.1 hypothetical protein [Clostridium sp.]MDU3351008.1 hypothetical protein [Clostridium sp.]MDU3408960.1 hypothetical protein [Clostridium sp.]MDU7089403.1 hypothetical protein [Clostridium sp.]